MEVKITDYEMTFGEVLSITVTPGIPYEKTSATTWNLFPDKDGIYSVEVESNMTGLVTIKKLPSLGVLTSKLNMLTMGIKRTEKEDLIHADIRSIVSCVAIEQYEEAQAQIEMATELWII